MGQVQLFVHNVPLIILKAFPSNAYFYLSEYKKYIICNICNILTQIMGKQNKAKLLLNHYFSHYHQRL